MSLTSFAFIGLLLCTAALYYILPIKYRYIALLIATVYFIANSNSLVAILIMAVTALITYGCAIYIENNRDKKSGKLMLTLGVVCVGGCLIITRDINFFTNTFRILAGFVGVNIKPMVLNPPSPMGISYFALAWIGYLLDVSWQTAKAEKNPLKFALFCGYFPLLTSGPIISFKDHEENIVTGHAFDYQNFCFGMQRILWGMLKKLVIASRLGIYVDFIYANYHAYVGLYVWIAFVFFVLQLYADFSGCIDIVLGASQLFGIKLPENFDLPFVSRNLSEFWRRWHITLGAWLRDYILYPILKSDLFQKIGAKSKKHFGKKTGKKIPVWIGMFTSWFLIGFWHGGYWNYILGVGLFFGCMIILGEMLSPITSKIPGLLKIDTESFGYHLFQSIRTLCMFTFGLSFFRAYGGFKTGLEVWRSALFIFNPWIFFDESLFKFGLDAKDWNVLIFYLMIMFVAGIIRYYKKESLCILLAKQPALFRYIVYLALIFSIVIFGSYGTGYDAQSFIYQHF